MAKKNKKPARKAAKKTAKKKPGKKKAAAKKPSRKTAAPRGLALKLPNDLEARLKMLGTKMNLSLAEVLLQAATEFAETWEHHLQTVAALESGSDRVQLSVPKE